MGETNSLEKAAIITTGLLFIDLILGTALTGKPLHESFGLNFPDYINSLEALSTASGMFYIISKDYHKPVENKNYNK